MNFSEGQNTGGLLQVELAPAYAFITLTPAVLFRAGYSWSPALILPESGQLTDETTETDNGLQYTYALSFAFNKKETGLLSQLRPYLGTLTIAKVTDQNGLVQIVGNLEAPLQLKQNADTGKRPTDQNQILITGSCVTRLETLIVTP